MNVGPERRSLEFQEILRIAMQIFAEVRLCGSSLQSGERVGEWETRFCVYPMENGEQPHEETRSADPARKRGEFCAATGRTRAQQGEDTHARGI
jgi:hypothetical protein